MADPGGLGKVSPLTNFASPLFKKNSPHQTQNIAQFCLILTLIVPSNPRSKCVRLHHCRQNVRAFQFYACLIPGIIISIISSNLRPLPFHRVALSVLSWIRHWHAGTVHVMSHSYIYFQVSIGYRNTTPIFERLGERLVQYNYIITQLFETLYWKITIAIILNEKSSSIIALPCSTPPPSPSPSPTARKGT